MWKDMCLILAGASTSVFQHLVIEDNNDHYNFCTTLTKNKNWDLYAMTIPMSNKNTTANIIIGDQAMIQSTNEKLP